MGLGSFNRVYKQETIKSSLFWQGHEITMTYLVLVLKRIIYTISPILPYGLH